MPCLAHSQPMPIWPEAAPGSAHLSNTEIIIERSTDPACHDRAATRITVPTLTPWLPEKPCGAAMLVVPGGAYDRVVIDKEGEEICQWLNSLGIAGFVLKYRLPDEMHQCGHLAPVQDAQRAIRLIRSQAQSWEIRPDRIGVIGFSAGGHLAGTLMTRWDYPVYTGSDAIDTVSARPDFAVLGYPVCGLWPALYSLPYDLRAKLIEEFTTDQHVRPDMPPTFLFHADDDPAVPVEQSLRIFNAQKDIGINTELHIFAQGGHGFGIRRAQGTAAHWPALCQKWLAALGTISDN